MIGLKPLSIRSPAADFDGNDSASGAITNASPTTTNAHSSLRFMYDLLFASNLPAGSAHAHREKPRCRLRVARPTLGSMRKKIVILGGGTGGTIVANRLRRKYEPDDVEVHVVDRDDSHLYQPGLLFVPFGLARADELVRSRVAQLRSGVLFHQAGITSVDVAREQVQLDDGTTLD